MSKIGKAPVVLPEGMTADIAENVLKLKYKDKEAVLKILDYVQGELTDNKLVFSISSGAKQAAANWGTMRALARNAVAGLVSGFTKVLEINGVGYRAEVAGDDLVLNVGFSHPVKFKIPAGIAATVEKNLIKISGNDKALVGETAARIRIIRKPEPYKGKGIKYADEIIKKKAGKKAASAG